MVEFRKGVPQALRTAWRPARHTSDRSDAVGHAYLAMAGGLYVLGKALEGNMAA
jgi:hypothetical protein